MNFKKIKHSFQYAWNGLRLAFKEEQSFRIQVFVSFIVLIMLFLFPLRNWERSLLVLVIGAVLVLELINSVIERFVDMVKPRIADQARQIKDLSAGAVLIVAFGSVVLGLIIFIPYLSLLSV